MASYFNPNLEGIHQNGDSLYHLNINSKDEDFSKFADVKFVCMGGKPSRMKICAMAFYRSWYGSGPLSDFEPVNLTGSLDRYVLYKVGPVLFLSHGVGLASIHIALHESVKLVQHAGCSDVIFIRIGTSGGLGVEPGTVVVTDRAFNSHGKEHHKFTILGQRVHRPCAFDPALVDEMLSCSGPGDMIVKGTTYCTKDFYEGQARLDGAICTFTRDEQQSYLQKLHADGVRNIEMEASLFSALLTHVNIPCLIVCVTLVDRLQGDQVHPSYELKQLEQRPIRLVVEFMTRRLNTLSRQQGGNCSNETDQHGK